MSEDLMSNGIAKFCDWNNLSKGLTIALENIDETEYIQYLRASCDIQGLWLNFVEESPRDRDLNAN